MRGSGAWRPGSWLSLSIVAVEPMACTAGSSYEVSRSVMLKVALSGGTAWSRTSTTARKRRKRYIRELQNIVERSVILSNGDTFRVERAWLSSQAARRQGAGDLTKTLHSYEKEIIEAALVEASGKVAGPNGAAARLGISRSTLDAKIKQLNIKKYSFR